MAVRKRSTKRKTTTRRRTNPYRYRTYQEGGWDPLNFKLELEPSVSREIIGILLLGLAGFVMLSIMNLAGDLGTYIYRGLRFGFGLVSFLLPVILTGFGIAMFYPAKYKVKTSNVLGAAILFLSLSSLLQIFFNGQSLTTALGGGGGGLIGHYLSTLIISFFDFYAGVLMLSALLVASLVLVFGQPLRKLYYNLKLNLHAPVGLGSGRIKINEPDQAILKFKRQNLSKFTSKTNGVKKEVSAKVNGLKPVETKDSEFVPQKLSDKAVDWEVPPLEILSDKVTKVNSGNIQQNIEIISQTLEDFGIEVEMAEVNVGPTVTQYTLKPATGVKLSKIVGLSQDLALALAAHPIRIEAPIPGRSLVGIEVPNKKSAIVLLRESLLSPSFDSIKSSLGIPLGRGVSGEPLATDLTKMPHLLIAGATGSGKSVFLNATLISLLYQNSPEDLRVVLVDPKRVEFTSYADIPHLLAPVITDPVKTINALKWLVAEMERRYKVFQDHKVRNIDAYNAGPGKSGEKMPYIVLMIDELADLMAVSARDVESYIARLAQMARATGIHLIIATQRPSVNVVTGLIKANFPSRITFNVTSGIDSRTILDSTGAEKLVGNGDMLFLPSDLSKPLRIQSPFISDQEIKGVTDFIKGKRESAYVDEVTEDAKKDGSFGDAEGEDLYDEAVQLVVRTGKASASYLQRRFRIGYARAARLIDLMETNGIVSHADGSKPRDILVDLTDLDPDPSEVSIEEHNEVTGGKMEGAEEISEDEED